MENLELDVMVLTETKTKGTGIEETGNYLHIFSGVKMNKRASKGVSILIHKKYKNKISNWEGVSERIVTLNFNHRGFKITIVEVYAPNEDASPDKKMSFMTFWMKS